jgi:hypothetical protein
MRGANATVGKDMMKQHSNDIFLFANKPNSSLADPANSCGSTTSHCHTASSQNQSASSHSMVPVFEGWNASAHNDKVVSINLNSTTGTHFLPNGTVIQNGFYGKFNAVTGFGNAQPNTCLQCKSPKNWNPSNKDNVTKINLTDFQGISCMVCHDLHDMGGWLNKTGKAYAWFNKTSSSTGTYDVMANTTQLCSHCHDNIRAGNTGPGWSNATGTSNMYRRVGNQTPIGTHGVPVAAVFVGSWKQTGLLQFECIDCHFSTDMNVSLPDSQKNGGHSFAVNETLLQNGQGKQVC